MERPTLYCHVSKAVSEICAQNCYKKDGNVYAYMRRTEAVSLWGGSRVIETLSWWSLLVYFINLFYKHGLCYSLMESSKYIPVLAKPGRRLREMGTPQALQLQSVHHESP